MEWLAIIGLAATAWWQSRRIGALMHKVFELEQRLALLERSPSEVPQAAPAPQPAAELEPLLLDQPLPPEEPLILDTPLPVASNDDEPLLLDQPLPPEPAPPPLEEPIRMPPAAATPPPRVIKQRERKLEQWLSQNGLAWLGGALIGLGGIFLVSFASQQPWFTPQVQLICAVLLGAALVAGGEWVRRYGVRTPPGQPLVAAMLAGAGVVTFYATAWAAHGLYELVDLPIAVTFLALCAAILLGLSLLHGQPLAVLAILLGLLAPQITGTDLWAPLALTFYIGAVAITGFGVAALQRWSWLAAATMLGLYFWFAAAIGDGDVRRALVMASFAAMGGAALAFRKPLSTEAPARLSWTQTHTHMPAAAICISSVLMLWTWVGVADLPSGVLGGPAWVAAMFVALAAASVRAQVAAPVTLTVAIASLALGFILYVQARTGMPTLGADFYPFILFAAAAIALSAANAQPPRESRALVAGSGAAGAAVLFALAASTRENWAHFSAWTPLFVGGAGLFAAAWFAAKETETPRTDQATGLWLAGATALVLLGVESAFPASGRIIGHAGVALALTGLLAWRGWGMARYAALFAAACAMAHAFAPSLIGAAMLGELPIVSALLILTFAALLLFGASFVASRVEPRALASESLGAAGVIIVLVGVFLGLRWLAAGGERAALDAFTEISLRILALMAAGHVLLAREGRVTGLIGAWRGHALLGAGLLYMLVSPAVAANPWWGAAPAAVSGPPLLNTLAIAFLAPALLLLFASRRLYERARLAARIYAGAGSAFALIWAVLETRRLFHGADMATGPLGLFEAACYALILLAAALIVAGTAKQRALIYIDGPFTKDLVTVSRAFAWSSIIAALFILLILRHPWWGAQNPETTNALSTLLAVAAQPFAIALALFLGRALSRTRAVEPARFAAAAIAVLLAWSFGHNAIRWYYHRGLMDNGEPLIQLEGIAHALWPLALILAASAITARAPGRDTVRAYLYDLQAIFASAIWPALAYAALGLWLLFNPWWGAEPSDVTPIGAAVLALLAFVSAAWMSHAAHGVPHVRWPIWFDRATTTAIVGHLFFAATLLIRRLYHSDDMATGAAGGVEMWVYSAVWALFGAGVFWLGMRWGDPLLRWIGLGLLLLTTLKVFLFDMGRLGGFIRVASFVGLGLVLLGIAWAARRFAAAPPPGPGDLLPIKPSARRGKRYGRRQRSS